MKKYLIIALSVSLLFAFFGCGSPKEEEKKNNAPEELGDLDEIPLTLPASTSATKANTGEANSLMYKFTGDDFAKIKAALPGSLLRITYKATVSYAVGEIGWIDQTNAGPIIIGNETNKNQTAYYNVEDVVIGTDNFTVHMYNPSTLLDVTLFAAPEGYVVKKSEYTGIKIIIPQGHPISGNGDLSKVDFKKINTAASGDLVFYFVVRDEYKDDGILKFGPKSGDPYKHFGIDGSDGKIYDESGKGWKRADDITKDKIVYSISDIKTAVIDAGNAGFAGGVFNKFEINIGKGDDDKAKADLLYIEIVP